MPHIFIILGGANCDGDSCLHTGRGIVSFVKTSWLPCCVTSRFISVIFEISHLVHNYSLVSKGFSYWVTLHLDVIIDPGEIFSWCNYFSLIRQVVRARYKLNWLLIVTLVSGWGSSTSNTQKKKKSF